MEINQIIHGDSLEIWKDIVGYEGYYKISSFGNVFSVRSGGNLKIQKQKSGYNSVMLSVESKKETILIHRVVGIHFIDNPNGKKCINHIDGVKTNNRLENLEWSTYRDNMLHSYSVLERCIVKGKQINNGKPILQKNLDGGFIKEWYSARDVYYELGFNYKSLSKALNRENNVYQNFIWEFKK